MKIVRPMTPLRRRMLEDMQIRNYSPHTIDGYIRYVAQFAKHFNTSPERLGPEHIRAYQVHLLKQEVSESIFIQSVCALRFLYEKTLHHPWMVEYIPYPKKPKKLPCRPLTRRSGDLDSSASPSQAPCHPRHLLHHRFAGLRTLSTPGHRHRLGAHGHYRAPRQRQKRPAGGALT